MDSSVSTFQMKSREKWIDTLRGIMMFFIVFGHTVSNGVLKQYVYSFHVPAFFFISGYLVYGKNESYSKYISKKIYTYMVPYYIFSVISIFMFTIFGRFASEKLSVGIKTVDIPSNLFGMLWANGSNGLMKWNLPLWFLPCMFLTLIAVYPILKLEYKQTNNLYLGSVLAFFVLLSLINYYFLHINGLPFQLETLVYMMPFTLAGALVHKCAGKIQKVKIIYGVVFVIVGFITNVFLNPHIDHVSYESSIYGCLPIFYISAVFSISGWIIVCTNVNWNIFSYIGRNTLPILLMHKFPIIFFQVIFLSLLEKKYVGTIFAILFASISCALCLIVAFPLKRYLPFVLGMKNTGSKKQV